MNPAQPVTSARLGGQAVVGAVSRVSAGMHRMVRRRWLLYDAPWPGTSASQSEEAGNQSCGSPRREFAAMTAAMATAMTMPPPSITGYVIHSMDSDSLVRIAGNAKPMYVRQ